MEIKSVLAERGRNYGEFRHQAELSQKLKSAVRSHLELHGNQLKPFQAESIEMMLHKIARIVNGDPSYADSWVDIVGYAQLVVDELGRVKQDTTAKAPIRAPETFSEPVQYLTRRDVPKASMVDLLMGAV